jgi:hypothetical protein
MRILRLGLLLIATLPAIAAEVAPTRSPTAAPQNQASVIIVAGAPGEKEYQEVFERCALLWREAAIKGGAKPTVIGIGTNTAASDLDLLQKTLEAEPKTSPDELWLVLIGHGTFDGRDARFNLRGPDFTATELGVWLQPFGRAMAIINTASSSGSFIPALSATNRVVVAATKSGFEQNYTRFGRFLSEAIADPRADLDRDGQTSLLEAFLRASFDTSEFYRKEGRIATEHPLLDDNGDTLGTPPDWFRGVRAIKKAKDGALSDGLRARQMHLVRGGPDLALSPDVRARRDAIEMRINLLRDQKSQFPEDEYYQRLEKLMLELAALYQE